MVNFKIHTGDPLDLFFKILITSLLAFSPLIYGGIPPLPLTIIESLCFLLFTAIIVHSLINNRVVFFKIPYLPLLLFLVLVIVQLYPLSSHLLSVISPSTSSLYTAYASTDSLNRSISIYPDATVGMGLEFVAFLGLFLTVLHHLDSKQKIDRLVLTVIVCATAYSLYGIFKGLPVKSFQYATFTNANHFAAYLEMIIPFSVAYIFIARNKTRKLLFAFITIIQIIALLLSLSRAGIVCCFFGMFLLFFLIGVKRGISKIMGTAAIVSVSLSLFLAIIGTTSIVKELQTLTNISDAYSSRLTHFRDSVHMVQDFPVLGVGLGAFDHLIQKYNTLGFYSIGFSHNEPLQLMAETGIAGFLLICIFLFFYLLSVVSIWRQRRDPQAVYITAAALAAIVSIILHSFFEFLFHVPANLLIFFIVLAIALKSSCIKSEQHQLPLPCYKMVLSPSIGKASAILFCGLFLFVETLIISRCHAQILYEKLLREKNVLIEIEAPSEYTKMLTQIDKAIACNPLNAEYISRKADIVFAFASRKDINQNDEHALGTYERTQTLSLVEKLYKDAIDISPTQAKYHFLLGEYYKSQGTLSVARIEIEKALKLDPQNAKLQNEFKDIWSNHGTNVSQCTNP